MTGEKMKTIGRTLTMEPVSLIPEKSNNRKTENQKSTASTSPTWDPFEQKRPYWVSVPKFAVSENIF
jgi:hypothetical protein